jgi:hypothetical protein
MGDMMETKTKQLAGLHARIDEDFDRREAELKTERQKSHDALNQLWPIIERGLIDSNGLTVPPYSTILGAETPAMEPASTTNGQHFSLKKQVIKVIESLDDNVEIHQRQVFGELIRRHPELRDRKEAGLRAQIANTLSRLSGPGGILKMTQASAGWNPAIYKRKPHK